MRVLLAACAPLLCLLSGGSAAAPDKKAPTPAEDFQRFQGTWQVESWIEAGKELPAADLKKRSVFFGANIFVSRRDGKLFQAGPAQIDPAKSPRTINLTIKEGDGKDGVMLGIYEHSGDTLKFCFDPQGQNRPEKFESDAKSGFTLITLKKPKPEVPEEINIVGKYRSNLVDPQGKTVIAQAQVDRRGDGYVVTYTREDKLLYIGTALRRGNQLSMAWVSSSQAGVSVYTIEPGPKLVGDYTILGSIGVVGREVLTPWKQID
jgi:uncharacterized protein (TIGR03067 family)